jgi:hypothetical protein
MQHGQHGVITSGQHATAVGGGHGVPGRPAGVSVMYHHPPAAVYAQSPSAAPPAQWGQSPWAQPLQPPLCGAPQGGYAASGPAQRLGPHAAALPSYWVPQSWGAPSAVNAAVGFGPAPPPQPSPHVLASAVGAAAAASSAAASASAASAAAAASAATASAASACFSPSAPCTQPSPAHGLKRAAPEGGDNHGPLAAAEPSAAATAASTATGAAASTAAGAAASTAGAPAAAQGFAAGNLDLLSAVARMASC